MLDNCLQVCGPAPEPVLEIVGYEYILVAAWAPIPQNPKLVTQNWKTTDDIVYGSTIQIPDWNPPSPWPGVHGIHNTCYGIWIRIYYEDAFGGHFYCDFEEWDCYIIG